MDKPGEAFIKLHQRIARGDKDPMAVGNYGVEALSATEGKKGESPAWPAAMKDSQRHPPIEGNQANWDHGPHE